jgi:hypothetical protein
MRGADADVSVCCGGCCDSFLLRRLRGLTALPRSLSLARYPFRNFCRETRRPCTCESPHWSTRGDPVLVVPRQRERRVEYLWLVREPYFLLCGLGLGYWERVCLGVVFHV